jgi:hypothetical protein
LIIVVAPCRQLDGRPQLAATSGPAHAMALVTVLADTVRGAAAIGA